ncbi:MAG: septal ring lytic transglycosylase RlpA family protein [Gammaproteobacteria bacterium]|nr:MAG: septal ring lytic transglycosylase RlpA family protein [Gammaproteobacteria bacterium]
MLHRKLLLLFALALIIQGCGIGYRRTHKPNNFPPLDPIPRKLQLSQYGNPESYEVFGKTYQLLPTNKDYTERGVASWYGKKFHGRRASSGDTYNMYAMTAAHKTLPIPVYAQVTNLENGRKVIVKINDRGPFVKNRLIDLSYAAATKLGVVEKGTAPVEVTTIIPSAGFTPTIAANDTKAAKPATPKLPDTKLLSTKPLPLNPIAPKPVAADTTKPAESIEQTSAKTPQDIEYFLQLGAFSDKINATRLIDRIKLHINETITINTVTSSSGVIHKVRLGPIESIERADLLTEKLEGFEIGTPRLIIANVN